MRKRALAGAAGAIAIIGLTASSCDDKGLGDANVGRYDDSPAFVLNMPDTFMNVAIKCDPAGFRIYAHTREAAPVVLPDPSCKGRTGVPEAYEDEGKKGAPSEADG